MDYQNTVKKEVTVSGITLHTGVRATLRILPAPENTGIVFRRVDMPGKPEVQAVAGNVIDVRRATTIASRTTGAFVVTVEHIMASLHASQVDTAIVEMDGPDNFEIVCHVEYGATPLDKQDFSCIVTPESFGRELSDSRTFCIYGELAQLLAAGLVKGGSLDNAVIMHDGAIISKDGMRHKEEFARHKMMDLVGDIFLTGMRVRAKVTAIRAGHPTHVKLAGEMLAQYAANHQNT